jgi:HSP20 family protein
LDDFTATFRLFDDFLNRAVNEPAGVRPWTPAVDIVETENDLTLTADIPGIKLQDIEIRLENGTLTISGERKFESEEKKGAYHRVERSYGAFQRAFALPETLDADKVSATYDSGVLKVTLPKKEIARPRSIKVNVSGN